jgi:hypothetical protein
MKWAEEEIEKIKSNYGRCGKEEFFKLLPNRTYKSIECMASKLGMSKPEKSWSKDELDALREYYPTSSPKEILKLLPDRNNQTITHMANKLGIYRDSHWWTEEEDELLRKFYDNKTVKELITMLPNRTNNGIKLRARILGLWQDESLPYRKYSHAYDFFREPNIINSYYAGLIASDGSVSEKTRTLRISLKQEDSYILEQFRKDIRFTGEVKYFEDRPGENSVVKDKEYVCLMGLLCLSGANQIIDDLKMNYNIVQNKTLVLDPPMGLSINESLALIVGYIDGDGHISLRKIARKRVSNYMELTVAIAGTFELLSWIKSIFDNISSSSKGSNAQVLKQKNSNIWTYSVGGLRAYHILKELQKIKTPTRLARKWNKIEEYKKLKNKRERAGSL